MPDRGAVSHHELIRPTIARNTQALSDRRYEDSATTSPRTGRSPITTGAPRSFSSCTARDFEQAVVGGRPPAPSVRRDTWR